MAENEISEFFANTGPIPQEDIPKFFKMLLSVKKETELTKRELKKYDSIKEVMIQEITGRYSFYEFLFSKIFAEREETIKKDFQVIDEGMRSKDRELIAAGLSGLSQVVASSPFTDFEKLHRLLGS